MNDEQAILIKRTPPSRDTEGPLRHVLDAIIGFLIRLFRRRHPGKFDFEVGSWRLPDVNLTQGIGVIVPRPLINRSCDKSILVYCFVSNPVAKCTLPGQFAALQQAIDQVAAYLRDHYHCENPNCLQEIAEPVWFGLDCGQFPGPADEGAVLVRFYCTIEQ